MGSDEGLDYFGIEVDAGAAPQLLNGLAGRPGRTVGPIRGHGIVGIDDGDDACLERDLVAPKRVGETAAVQTLVMGTCDSEHARRFGEEWRQDLLAQRRV